MNTMPKVGRKKELPVEVSKQIINQACNKAGGPYALSKKFKISHPHLSRCRTGEEGLSNKLANTLLVYVLSN